MEKITFKCIWFCAFSLCLPYLAFGQNIEEVRDSFDQTHQLMIISYNIKKFSFKKKVQVLPIVYVDSDSLELIKSTHVNGDLGWIKHKKIYVIFWDAFRDGFDDFASLQFKLKVNIEKNDPKNAITWTGSNSAPIGFKLAHFGSFGWYTSLRVGNLPPTYKYTVQNTGQINAYNESGVYEIGKKSRVASYAFTVGSIIQLNQQLHSYIGVGYGKEQLFWEYKSYNLNKQFIGNQWALNESINHKGLFFDLGLIVATKRFSYDIGFSSNSFNSFQIIGGIGILLDKKQ